MGLSEKVDMRKRNITRDKERYFIMKKKEVIKKI